MQSQSIKSASIYRSLLHPADIRLLHLRPGSFDAQLQCHLKYVNLQDDPTYEALSYVWGDPLSQEIIKINEQPWSITTNLGDALRRLRLPKRPRVIWADAICINQNDLEERSKQIPIMRMIYSQALRVMVWLGQDEDGDMSDALHLMTVITQTCEMNSQSRGRRWMDLTSQERYKLADLHHLGSFGDASNAAEIRKYWDALGKFFENSWFTRIWCVQEIVMARESFLLYGDADDIPWHLVGTTATWFEAQNMAHDFNIPDLIQGVNPVNAQIMYGYSDPEERFDNVLDALSAHREFGATDPRDKIYAVLGLVNGDTNMVASIPIDYQKSVVQIYIDTAVAAINVSKDLFFLSFVQHPLEYVANPGFPSWVPRWDVSLSEATRIGQYNNDEDGWRANGSRQMETFSVTPKGYLRIRGFVYDTVSYLSGLMDYTQFEHRTKPNISADALPFLHTWKNLIYSPSTEQEDFLRMLCFARTLTGQLTIDYQAVMELEEDERVAFYNDFFAYVNHLNHLFHPPGNSLGISQGDLGDDKVELGSDMVEFAAEGGQWQRYSIAASRMCDHRHFFRMNNHQDEMGIGPAAMHEGDIVVILFGSRVPFILRPIFHDSQAESSQKAKQINHFHLIGEAFISDIMYGEVMERVEKKEEEFEEVEFEIH